jgi:opacity protein-like surface antigen
VQVPFDATSQSPFVGTYIAITKDSFFLEGLARYNSYDSSLNSPGTNLFNQKSDAHGYSLSGSLGYQYSIPNSNWFIEPSAGLIWSRASVGVLNVDTPESRAGPVQGFSGTAQINDITSTIGRAGLRFGATVETNSIVWQPFVAVSVWHDFASNITANYSACANCFFFGSAGTFNASMSQTNVGTYGQYSAGVTAQLPNTGWLGFVRVDYRNGSELQSLSGTGGIRYQFMPEAASAVMLVKAPVYKAPLAQAVNWTGLYVGGFTGADYGWSELSVPGSASAGLNPSGVLAGGTLGYNYQIGRYVLGIEGDGGWTNLTGSAPCAPLSNGGDFGAPPVSAFFQTTCHEDVSWVATVAGRAGYLWTPRTLLYLKAGVAWAHETSSATCNLGPLNGGFAPNQTCYNQPVGATGVPLLNSISVSGTRVGGMIGYGAEFALTSHWSAKGEFDWIGFGTRTLSAPDGTPLTAKSNIVEAKIGVNYRWGQ